MSIDESQTFLRELDRKLWTAADKLRSSLDAAVYKHAVLGDHLPQVPLGFLRRAAAGDRGAADQSEGKKDE